ncbi:Gene Transfer Agent tail tape measure [Candidatus Rhodobacter oscarellae]|uniref:Gene Transfer Agent tail tape measure n=1 Tax=Candidatus Rhodobacter oscarellae TaxID=1675527 RepID=A0A0J9E1H1_9RHOB|nr:phage tail tape measure protein [Candidatus Rhodobacter lobularis]KMW56585.1 Gene Transfer Agent tail tape measure [Candidatus Rhodobacter lobularis]
MDEDDLLGSAIAPLELNAEEAARSVATLTQEVSRNGEESRRAADSYRISSDTISNQVSRAFRGLIQDGDKLSDVLRNLALSISEATFAAAIEPVADHIGSGISGFVNGLLGFRDGGAFAQGRVMPFARGGVVSSPVTFPMRGGMGLMGEAGPEAIMPLSRGPDGKLGVRAGGGGRPVSVVMNIQTPDVEGFRRSQSQVAAQMSRALSRGQRNR